MSDKMKIYLCGYMNKQVITNCISWRKLIRSHYENWKDKDGNLSPYPLEFLDPFNGENLDDMSSDGLKGTFPPHMIVHKDYIAVKKADLIIANMSTFGESRPPIGSICELAWAYEFRKPIVVISNEDIYKNHPFISYFASCIVSSVDELLERKLINSFYKSFHSAQY